MFEHRSAKQTQRNATARDVEGNLDGLCVCMAARCQLASGSDAQLFDCRAFQTVEVTHAQRRLLKDMLSHF